MRNVFVLGFSVFLSALSTGVRAEEPSEPDPAEKASRSSRPQLAAGDRFVMALTYSNVWEVSDFTTGVAGGPRGPLSREELESLSRGLVDPSSTPELRRIPRAEDPLIVNFQLNGTVTKPGELNVVPRFAKVKYFDGSGRAWSLNPNARRDRAKAEKIVRRLSPQWRADLEDELEREMLEEQLLGAALALLHDAEVNVTLERLDAAPAFPKLGELLDVRLPEVFPSALRQKVVTFLRQAIEQAITPAAADLAQLRRGREFQAGALTYKVGAVTTAKDGYRVRAEGWVERDDEGRRRSDRLVFDAGTGLVIEGTSTIAQDHLEGNTMRIGVVRWHSKLKSLNRAAKSRKSR